MAKKRHVSIEELSFVASKIAEKIVAQYGTMFPTAIYGVPRGGVTCAYAVASAASSYVTVVDTPDEATVIIDDIVDSGKTRDYYLKKYPHVSFMNFYDKGDEWLVFPYEMAAESSSADDIPIRLLQHIGENPERQGLAETPERFLKAWKHWTSGYDKNPEGILKVFEDGAENYDQMVLVKKIPVYSKCEHHLADIWGVAHVAYIPDGKIVGLSKLNRLVDMFARRLQVQERLTNQIADSLNDNLSPKGVAVVLECRHMCMESRGVCQQGHSTTTSAMRGAFMAEENTRQEFLKLIKD